MRVTLRRWTRTRFGFFQWPTSRPAVTGFALGLVEIWRITSPPEAEKLAERHRATQFARAVRAARRSRVS